MPFKEAVRQHYMGTADYTAAGCGVWPLSGTVSGNQVTITITNPAATFVPGFPHAVLVIIGQGPVITVRCGAIQPILTFTLAPNGNYSTNVTGVENGLVECAEPLCNSAGPLEIDLERYPYYPSYPHDMFKQAPAVTILDPVPGLLNGAQITASLPALASRGRVVQGIAADGIAQVVFRIPAFSSGDTVTATLLDENMAPSAQSDANGGLFAVGGAVTSAESLPNTLPPVTATTIDTSDPTTYDALSLLTERRLISCVRLLMPVCRAAWCICSSLMPPLRMAESLTRLKLCR